MGDGTGVPLDGVRVVVVKSGGLNTMVDGENARLKRTEDGRECWWDKFRIMFSTIKFNQNLIEVHCSITN